MPIPKSNFLIFFISIFISNIVNAQVVLINEVLSSNSTFYDNNGETPDWIELYNNSQTTVDLSGWVLTDKENESKWTFGEEKIDANGYLLVWASATDKPRYYPRTLIDHRNTWKYLIPNGPVELTWININYNDDAWLSGPSGFGYGDGDDDTSLPFGSSSVFMRKAFTISDISIVEQIILDIDYDDGFVAYLNGKEVARANMSQERPNYDDYTITDHEAVIYQGLKPDRFEIDKSLLIEGQNIISIQAHNTTNVSSDFTLIPFLTVMYNQETTDGIQTPEILEYSETALHTNFKVSEGETLFLYDGNGVEISKLSITQTPPDVSLGLRPSDQTVTMYEQPSPNEKNAEEGFDDFITEKIEFSSEGGLVDQLQLTLSSPVDNYIILYTTDATIPNATSNVYSSPISISNNTVVRARLYRQGLIPSRTQTRTFILDSAHDIPMVSLVTEPDNFFSDETGIYVLGEGVFPDFPYEGSNIWEDWERPIHFSLFEQNELALEFDAGTKIFGGWSRALDQRSLSIFARGQYGLSEINYPLFPNRSYDKYQAFILRNSGNDFLSSNIRDITLTSLMDGSGLETQAYKSVVTYINGQYWGIFNMREKMNEHYLSSMHDIDPDQIDILGPFDEVIQGSDTDYKSMLAFLETNTLTNDDNYQWISDQVDIDNFIIYHIAQIYIDNTDWPGNNNKQWRPKDGKWRWLLYDTDFGFGIWNPASYFNNTLAFALEPNGPFWPNPPNSTLLLRRLLGNITFRNKFINQFADELNSRFLPQKVEEHIEILAAKVASEIPNHYALWGSNPSEHNNKIDDMVRFGNQRPARVKVHIRNQFSLPDYHQITLKVNDSDEGFIKINSLTINDEEWKGDYFENVPIKITAYPKQGYTFSHWTGSGGSNSAELTLDMQSDISLKAVFVPSNDEPTVIINEINYNSSDDNDSGDWIELYNPNESPIDLAGWVITDKEFETGYIIPNNTQLQGGDFLILSKDESKFNAIHTNIENVIGDLSFGLSSDGESVKMYSADGVLTDSVSYLPTNPWSEMANGQGYTLELKSPELDNAKAENWTSYRLAGSPGETNDELSSFSEIDDHKSITLSPNPFIDAIQVDLELNSRSYVSAKLYNLEGQLIVTIVDKHLSLGKHTITDDLSNLDGGVYLLEVKTGDKQEVFQWVKL